MIGSAAVHGLVGQRLRSRTKEHALHAEAIHFSRDTACTQTIQITRQDSNYARRHKTQTTQRALTAPKTNARARHTRGIHSWREIQRGCTRQGSSRSLWPAKLQLVPAAKDPYLRLQAKRAASSAACPRAAWRTANGSSLRRPSLRKLEPRAAWAPARPGEQPPAASTPRTPRPCRQRRAPAQGQYQRAGQWQDLLNPGGT